MKLTTIKLLKMELITIILEKMIHIITIPEEMNCSVFNIGKFPHGDARYTIRYDKANNSF